MTVESRTFGPQPESVHEARHFAASCLPSLAEAPRDVVALIVSELAANAVLHTGSGFVLHIDHGPDLVHVAVSDFGAGDPTVLGPDPGRAYGRGLLLVERLSDSWGVTPGAGGAGKTVWASLGVGGRAW